METIWIILLTICCCCCSSIISSTGGLFYKPKFSVIGGGMVMNDNKNLKINKLECSDDAFITEIYGKYDKDINYLGIKCSDDNSPEPIGINIGTSFSDISNEGYQKINFKKDNINKVIIRPAEDKGKDIKPEEKSFVLKYMKLFSINNKEKEFGKSDDFYEEDQALCRNNEKLTSINMLSNDSKKITGLNDWRCGTNASLFEIMFRK